MLPALGLIGASPVDPATVPAGASAGSFGGGKDLG